MYIYHSNQLDLLKSLLVEIIRHTPLGNPFEQEQILVQSPGMSQWLKMELAKSFGVAANIEFPLPATYIWKMFTQVLADVPERSAFNKEAMTWKLMQVLPQQLELPEFEPLKRYLENDPDSLKIYQLAEKIADIFDQYLVYRPEWIQQWEAGETVSELEGEHPWQPVLWQALYDHTLASGQSPYHRANLYEHFIDTLENYTHSGTLPEGFPKRLFVFGISSLPPRYLDALAAIGKHIDVHLMFTNPCRYYWGDIRDRKYLARLAARQRLQVKWSDDHCEPGKVISQLKDDIEDNLADETHEGAVGNTLLASMGKLGRDNLYLLSEMQAQEMEAFVDIKRDTLLHFIQDDILNLEDRQNDEIPDSSSHKLPVEDEVKADDNSLSIHACHSPMREVEVLHDNLLAMFEAESAKGLKPRDVIVMVADINAYSPAIQAVFGNAPGNRYIPFSISDRSAEQENPILQAFLRLLTLPESRCNATELLELLEVPAVMNKFGFDSNSFEKIKRWIEEAGVRWGLDEKTACQFELPGQNQNTWLFGIQRMLLGYAMPHEAGLFDDRISAYEQVQGLDAELAGQLAEFIDSLVSYREKLAQPQSVTEWSDLVNQLLDDFLAVEPDDELVLKSIRDNLHRLHEQLEDAGYQTLITPAVLTRYLQDKLSGERMSQRFLAGQVNFCTLMPMRSIPFRVVCLLGMNDGTYPRSIAPEGFDLMNGRTRAGDRSRRDDDRYLFLEAILSAQKTLYISYVGRSIRDNTEKVPSVLVSELVEYCQQGYCMAGDKAMPADESADRIKQHLIHHHPLVPFSPKAFSGEHVSFAAEWLPAAAQEGQASKEFQVTALDAEPMETGQNVLELAELEKFWHLPVKYFFNRRLKVYFKPPTGGMKDDEPFDLNGLDSYWMRDELLKSLLETRVNHSNEDDVFKSFVAGQKAAGKLPVAAFGELAFEAIRDEAVLLADKILPLTESPLDDHEVDDITLDVDGHKVRLQGWLKQRYKSGLVRYRSGRIRAQDRLAAWLDHLCLAASGNGQKTHIIGITKGVVEHVEFSEIDKDKAQEHLQTLVELYYQGLKQPLPYFPKTAQAGIDAFIEIDPEQAQRHLKALDDLYDKGLKWPLPDFTKTAQAGIDASIEDGCGKEDQKFPEKSLKEMAKKFNDDFMYEGEGSDDYIVRVWPQWSDNLAEEVFQLAVLVLQPAVSNSVTVKNESRDGSGNNE